MTDHSKLTADNIALVEHKVLPLVAKKPKEALRILQNAGMQSCVDALQNPKVSVTDHTFTCPATKTALVTNCDLSSCKFHIKNDLANNCLLAYCHQQDIDALSYDEMSFLLGVSVREVRTSVEKSMQTLRLQTLVASAEEDPDLRRSFSFVETTEVCCVCGSVTDENRILLEKTPLAFCSTECAIDEKSTFLEWKFGIELNKLLSWAFHKFKNIGLLEKTLGLNRTVLQRMSMQFLDRELSDFYPDHKEQKSDMKSNSDEPTLVAPPVSLSDLKSRMSTLVKDFSVYFHD